ncbi:MAG: hypothetical protein A6F71_10735 [Cycloclasticus sp. symbiont of Poecilosclerida sp. M]|nr:MAG: hypothetical protein A6F71_10735 [Cycloclasticus sp. symbiont of Poecilosclerida sp. M]
MLCQEFKKHTRSLARMSSAFSKSWEVALRLDTGASKKSSLSSEIKVATYTQLYKSEVLGAPLLH